MHTDRSFRLAALAGLALTIEGLVDRLPSIDRRTAAIASAGVFLIPIAFVLLVPHPLEQPLGVDFALYRDATSRWLHGGPFFEPYQLAGPYEIRAGDVLYPPVGLWLFVPFAALDGALPRTLTAFAWWVVPLAITGWAIIALRPRPVVWPLLALCAANPTSLLKIWTGNPVMWSMAAMALAVVGSSRFAGPFVLLKPSLAPFALFGVTRRSWWVGLAVVVVLSLPFGSLWADWLTSVLNSRGGGALYSFLEVPMLLLPLVAWLGRTRGGGGARALPAGRTLGHDQVGVFGMAFQEAGDELALRHEAETAPPDVVEGAAGESPPDTHALRTGQDLGVDEDDRARLVGQLVLGDADHPVAQPRLVARLLGVVLHDERRGDRGRWLGHHGILDGPAMDCARWAFVPHRMTRVNRSRIGYGNVLITDRGMRIDRAHETREGDVTMATGTGTKDDPWVLKTPPGTSEYTMYRDDASDPPTIVCQVGGTRLLYDARAIDELHAMLKAHGDWMPLGGADEQKPATDGSVEAWGRSEDNPRGGWYGLKKGLRGRFGVYMPPLLEALGLVELTHDAKNNQVRAK